MKATEFCFWLQGHFEMNGTGALSADQAEMIQRHLSLVFKHEIDPSQGTTEHQAELQALHDANLNHGQAVPRC